MRGWDGSDSILWRRFEIVMSTVRVCSSAGTPQTSWSSSARVTARVRWWYSQRRIATSRWVALPGDAGLETGAPTPAAGTPDPASDRRHIGPPLLAAAALFALWVALSQKLDAFHLGLGLIAAFGIAFATRGIYRSPPRPMSPQEFLRIPRRCGPFVAYAGWLGWEILLAASSVAMVVLRPRMRIDPKVLRLRDNLPHPIARMTLAHSITLTPGTLTVDCDDDALAVHFLDGANAGTFTGDGGPITRRVRRLFAQPGPSA